MLVLALVIRHVTSAEVLLLVPRELAALRNQRLAFFFSKCSAIATATLPNTSQHTTNPRKDRRM